MSNLNFTKTTNKEITLKADMFIVPNHFWILKENKLTFVNEREKALFGITDDAAMMEVWFTNSEVDNLSSNKWTQEMMEDDRLKDFEYLAHGKRPKRALPTHLPAEPFKDLDDGDKIFIEYNDKYAIEVTMNQKQYRYKNHGSFKELYNTLNNTLAQRKEELAKA